MARPVTYDYDQNGDKVSRDGEGNPNRLKDSMLNYMANIWIQIWQEEMMDRSPFITRPFTNILPVLWWVDSWPGRWSCGTK